MALAAQPDLDSKDLNSRRELTLVSCSLTSTFVFGMRKPLPPSRPHTTNKCNLRNKQANVVVHSLITVMVGESVSSRLA